MEEKGRKISFPTLNMVMFTADLELQQYERVCISMAVMLGVTPNVCPEARSHLDQSLVYHAFS